MDNFHDLELYIEDSKNQRSSIDMGHTPLCIACASLNAELVEELLEDSELDLNITTMDGKTPLHMVCIPKEDAQSFKIINLLIQKGYDINARDKKNKTPLFLACNSENAELVKILLKSGSLVNTSTISGDTPLKRACKNAEYLTSPSLFPVLNIANQLLCAGARDEATCLPVAVQFGTYKEVEELLNSGMNVNMLDDSGRSALGTACSVQTVDVNVVKLLLKHGADVNKGGAWVKQKPLIFAYAHNSFAKIKVLLSYGAYITSEEMTGLVSISLSKSILENPEVVNLCSEELLSWRLLLAAGFTPTVQGLFGNSNDLANKINQVQMCSSYHYISPWIKSLIFPVRDLKEWCRISIHRCLRPCIEDSINQLEIPVELRSFLSFKDLSKAL